MTYHLLIPQDSSSTLVFADNPQPHSMQIHHLLYLQVRQIDNRFLANSGVLPLRKAAHPRTMFLIFRIVLDTIFFCFQVKIHIHDPIPTAY